MSRPDWTYAVQWWFTEWWWAALRITTCAWSGHRPREIGSTSLTMIQPQWITFPEGEITIGETTTTNERHNLVVCRRCRTILASAKWAIGLCVLALLGCHTPTAPACTWQIAWTHYGADSVSVLVCR